VAVTPVGLFRNVGRRVEKLKHEVTDAAESEAAAECGDCGTAVYTDRETCPECGSDDLLARDPAED
jgi:uncharacterized OB-fold protein